MILPTLTWLHHRSITANTPERQAFPIAIRELFRGTLEGSSKTSKTTREPFPHPQLFLQSPPKNFPAQKKEENNETQVFHRKKHHLSLQLPKKPWGNSDTRQILSPSAPRNKPPQMVPRDLNIAFQLLAALIQVLQLSFHLRPKQNNSKPPGTGLVVVHT